MGKEDAAAEVKKEDLLGAVAIKPPGWDRTGFEAFRYFLYDPDNGTILSRTPKSWALITIFYTIYYSCLAAFWYVCLLIFFQTLPDAAEGPKWQQDGSLIGINPGVGIRPLNRDSRIDSNMFVLEFRDSNDILSEKQGEGDLNIDYARRAQLFFEENYGTVGEGYNEFDRAAELGDCAQFPYGFINPAGGAISPCVFLKFNKIWGWEPTPVTEEDFAENPEWPAEFKSHWDAQADKEKIWIHCQGRNPADKEALADGGMTYLPATQGFPATFFPYTGNKEGYQSPLVAVNFNLDEKYIGQLIHIECRAYYKGVRHETKSKTGLVQFEVLMK